MRLLRQTAHLGYLKGAAHHGRQPNRNDAIPMPTGLTRALKPMTAGERR